MPTPLLPQLARLDGSRYGDGSRPLPRARLERLCQLVADDEYTNADVGRAMRVSPRSVIRARGAGGQGPRGVPADQAATRAAEDAPLARLGNRIRLVDELARDLRQHLTDNKYEATIGVTKLGQPIVGFDRGRTAELLKAVDLLDSLTTGRQTQPKDTTNVGISVTMTTADAVTRVQALLSRTASPGEAPLASTEGGIGGYLMDGQDG